MAPDNEYRKELEEMSPLLSRISKNNIYTTPPAGYFEGLSSDMLSRVKQVKVIPMRPRTSPWRTLAAAVVTGAVLVSGWLVIINNSPSDHPALTADANIQKQMQQVSDTEMAAYVDAGNGVAGNDELQVSGPINDDDVPLVLADVSDQELQQYVDQEIPSTKLN